MSSGYAIYSLDWGKFQRFVSHPTDKQLAVFARAVPARNARHGYHAVTARKYSVEATMLAAILFASMPFASWLSQ